MKLIKDKSQAILLVITIIMLATNILLIVQNLRLQAVINKSKPPQPEIGDKIEFNEAKGLNGGEIKLDYTSENKKRVILYFRTTCGYCHEQMVNWKNLASHLDNQKYKITAITVEPDFEAIKAYLKTYEIENLETLTISPKDAQKVKLLSTPMTVVVSSDGTVEKVWRGIWDPNDLNTVSKYFVIAPGVFEKSG